VGAIESRNFLAAASRFWVGKKDGGDGILVRAGTPGPHEHVHVGIGFEGGKRFDTRNFAPSGGIDKVIGLWDSFLPIPCDRRLVMQHGAIHPAFRLSQD
jgi:hypothetical protein